MELDEMDLFSKLNTKDTILDYILHYFHSDIDEEKSFTDEIKDRPILSFKKDRKTNYFYLHKSSIDKILQSSIKTIAYNYIILLNDNETTISECKHKIETLQKAINDLNIHNLNLNTQIDILAKKNKELIKNNEALKLAYDFDNNRQTAEIKDAVKETKEKLKAEFNKQKEEIIQKNTKKITDNFNKQIDELKKKIDEFKKKIDELSKIDKETNVELIKIKIKNIDFEEKLQEKSKIINDLIIQNNNYKKKTESKKCTKCANLEKECLELKTKGAGLDKECLDLKTKYMELDKEFLKLKTKCLELETKCEELEKECDELDKDYLELETKYNEECSNKESTTTIDEQKQIIEKINIDFINYKYYFDSIMYTKQIEINKYQDEINKYQDDIINYIEKEKKNIEEIERLKLEINILNIKNIKSLSIQLYNKIIKSETTFFKDIIQKQDNKKIIESVIINYEYKIINLQEFILDIKNTNNLLSKDFTELNIKYQNILEDYLDDDLSKRNYYFLFLEKYYGFKICNCTYFDCECRQAYFYCNNPF